MALPKGEPRALPRQCDKLQLISVTHKYDGLGEIFEACAGAGGLFSSGGMKIGRITEFSAVKRWGFVYFAYFPVLFCRILPRRIQSDGVENV